MSGNLEQFELGISLIPEGTYRAVISDAGVRENKKGTGHYVSVSLQILSGKYQNSRLWANMNIAHTNVRASNIGIGVLHTIATAVGIKKPKEMKDTNEICGIPLQIEITHRAELTGEIKEQVSRYLPDAPASAPDKADLEDNPF